MRYAPDQLQTARQLRLNLEDLIAQGHFEQAVQTGTQAVAAAEAALWSKVNAAEDAIATARRYDAFSFEPDRMARAIVSVRQAREQIEAGRYQEAELNAQQALTSATHSIRRSREASFRKQLDSLNNRLAQATKGGTGFYHVAEVAQIVGEMNQLRAQFDPEGYEDFAQRVGLLETQLAGMMETTPDVIEEMVVRMQEHLAALEARGARRDMSGEADAVRQHINYAELDFRNSRFRSSYENAKKASELLALIEQGLAEREFDARLTEFMREFSGLLNEFGPVLDMGSTTMMQLVIDTHGRARAVAMLNALPPTTLRTRINEIGARVQVMAVPATRMDIHESMLRMLEMAKDAAAGFERMLILDQYGPDQARDVVQTAYVQMLNARHRQLEIMETIQYPQVDDPVEGVQRVLQ